MLGTHNLHEILSDRETIATSMQTVLDEATGKRDKKLSLKKSIIY